MKRLVSISLAGLVAIAMISGSATAQEGTMPDWADKTGGFGVGAETTLGGTNGLNLRYFVSNALGLQLTFGLNLSSRTTAVDDADDTVVSLSAIDFGLYGSYKLAYWQRGHLSAILGVDIQMASMSTDADGDDGDSDASGTDILIGLGLQGEVFLSQYFSVFGQVGLRLDFIGENEPEGGSVTLIDDEDTTGIDVGVRGDLLGAFGFTVWFQ